MTVADIAEVCVMAINRVVNRSRDCCIKQIKLFREDIAVRFFIISDLHLGEETDMQQLYTRTRTLCRKIRESTTPGEQIPIILLGDIVDGGNPDAFCAAKKLLTKIEQELKDYSTTFDFVPGNHDLHGTDLAAFDKFISKYGGPKFSENRAYNRQYGGVNFIFADSNLSRDHRACGEIDVAAIIELVKGGMTNVLLCHHSFTQEYGDTHDVINGGERFLEILAGHEIKFLIHGHTHRAAIDVHPYTVKEIGCGSFSKDSKKMGNIYKQFTVGCIREGTIVSIERWIDTDDGGEPFAYTQLFPKERQFKDPDSVGKQMIDAIWENRTVEDYETTSSTVKTDFMRKWHHNRSGKAISLDEMMENEDGDIFEVADPRGEFEQKVISEMQIAAFAEQNITDKDREILKLRMDGHTEQEIADKVGYKTASAVHKRIAKIASAYEDFVTAEYGKYLDK